MRMRNEIRVEFFLYKTVFVLELLGEITLDWEHGRGKQLFIKRANSNVEQHSCRTDGLFQRVIVFTSK